MQPCTGPAGGEDRLPEFTDIVENRTVVAGREAVLSCHVNHLGSYKVQLSTAPQHEQHSRGFPSQANHRLMFTIH